MLTEDQASAARRMMRVVSYAETVDLVPTSTKPGIDLEDFEAAMTALAEQGIGRRFPPTREPANLRRIAEAALSSIEESPAPSVEWSLTRVLGDRLASLVGISTSSMTRYRTGARTTPDDIAERLHVVAQIVTDLAGSYNDYGIRRWFERPRGTLAGRAPAEILTGAWDPSAADVAQVRSLAAALTS